MPDQAPTDDGVELTKPSAYTTAPTVEDSPAAPTVEDSPAALTVENPPAAPPVENPPAAPQAEMPVAAPQAEMPVVTDIAQKAVASSAPAPKAGNLAPIRPIPRISMQAFCETNAVLASIEHTAEDRRMAKAHVKVHMGGIAAATDFYGQAPTPNLVIVESSLNGEELVGDLERLAEVCDPGSKVVVIGHHNDVQLYRELISRGVSEYLVAPVSMADVMKIISDLFVDPEAAPLGQTYAFIGAKGGVGSSTISHNVAWCISSEFSKDAVIADLDLAFGTANINFDQDPAQGIAEAVYSADRIDDTFLDRLLAKCSDHLSLLAAPSMLDRTYDFEANEFNQVIQVAQRNIPCVILDLPHIWAGWTRQVLSSVDHVIVTAVPDLANLRNAKNLIDTLKELRPNDSEPYLVLNQVGMPKRPEISIADFSEPLNIEPIAAIPFNAALFGTAANNGQMIAETDAKHDTVALFSTISHILTGQSETKTIKKQSGGSLLGKLLGKNK